MNQKDNSPSVLITGGAGFIGSHLVDELMNLGSRISVVDNLSNGSRQNINSWLSNPSFRLIQADLKDLRVATELMEGIDVVYHLAANPDVRLGAVDPSVHFNENLLVTFNVLEAMRKSRTAKKIVFASSSAVYGEPERMPTPEDYGPLFPISIYGASKLGCETLISSYCHTFDFQGILLRFANIIGSRSSHGVIYDFIKKLSVDPNRLEILGDGEQKKSYLHVKDLISGVLKTAENRGINNAAEVYNIGSEDQVKVKRIAEIVCSSMGSRNTRFEFNNILGDGRGWKGDVRMMQLSIEKLKSLGWRPSLSSEEAVRMTCEELLPPKESGI